MLKRGTKKASNFLIVILAIILFILIFLLFFVYSQKFREDVVSLFKKEVSEKKESALGEIIEPDVKFIDKGYCKIEGGEGSLNARWDYKQKIDGSWSGSGNSRGINTRWDSFDKINFKAEVSCSDGECKGCQVGWFKSENEPDMCEPYIQEMIPPPTSIGLIERGCSTRDYELCECKDGEGHSVRFNCYPNTEYEARYSHDDCADGAVISDGKPSPGCNGDYVSKKGMPGICGSFNVDVSLEGDNEKKRAIDLSLFPVGSPEKPDYYLTFFEKGDRLGCSFNVEFINRDEKFERVWLEDEDGNVIIEKADADYAFPYYFDDERLYSDDSSLYGKKIKCKADIDTGVASEGIVTLETDYLVINRNIKDKTKFEKIPAFLVSSKDWRDVLSSVPAVMWESYSDSEEWCMKMTDVDEYAEDGIKELEKCAYPLIVYDENELDENSNPKGNLESFKDGSEKDYPLQEFYSENGFMEDGRRVKINRQGVLDFWKQKGLIVVSDYTDYKTSLLNSQLAAYLNAPLILVSKENRKEWENLLKNKFVIIVGNIDKEILEEISKSNVVFNRLVSSGGSEYLSWFTQLTEAESIIDEFQSFFYVKQLVRDYIPETNSYKNEKRIIFTNPNDINPESCDSIDGNLINCKMSLLASVLAFGDDARMEFIENDPSPGKFEMELKANKIEEEEMKEEPNIDVINALENDIDQIGERLRVAIENTHEKVWEKIDSYDRTMTSYDEVPISLDIYFLAGPKAIPYRFDRRLSSYSDSKAFKLSINAVYDDYYLDKDGIIDCSFEIVPDGKSDRFYGSSLSGTSARMSMDLLKLPRCSELKTGGTATGEVVLTGNPTQDSSTGAVWNTNRVSEPAVEYLLGFIDKYRYVIKGIEKPYVSEKPYSVFGSYYITLSPADSSEKIEEFLSGYHQTKIKNFDKNSIGCKLKKEAVYYSEYSIIPTIIPTSGTKLRLNPDTKRTLSLSPNEQSIAVAYYYSTMNELKQALFMSLEAIAADDKLLKEADTDEEPLLPKVTISAKVINLLPVVQEYKQLLLGGSYSTQELDSETIARFNSVRENLNKMPFKRFSDETKAALISLQAVKKDYIILIADEYRKRNMEINAKRAKTGVRDRLTDDYYHLVTVHDKDKRESTDYTYPFDYGRTANSIVSSIRSGIVHQEEMGFMKRVEFLTSSNPNNDENSIITADEIRQLIDAKKDEYYWIRGDVFGEKFNNDLDNLNKALIAQLKESRAKSHESISRVQAAIECMHTKNPMDLKDPETGVINREFLKGTFERCEEKVNSALKLTPQKPFLIAPSNKEDKEKIESDGQYNTMLSSNEWFKKNEEILVTYAQIKQEFETARNYIIGTATVIGTFGLGPAGISVSAAIWAIRTGAVIKGFVGFMVTGIDYYMVSRSIQEAIEYCNGELQIGTGKLGEEKDAINVYVGPVVVSDAKSCAFSYALNGIFAGTIALTEIKYIHNLYTLLEKAKLTETPVARAIINDNYARAAQKAKARTARTRKLPVEGQPGCFLANTKIKMADGSYKNIQDIKEGEKVMAYDIEEDRAVKADITKTFKRQAEDYLIIDYEVEK